MTRLCLRIGLIKQHDLFSFHTKNIFFQELSGKAREGKLQPHEYQGGSFR